MVDSFARNEEIPPVTEEDARQLNPLEDTPILAWVFRWLMNPFEEDEAASLGDYEAETMLNEEFRQLGRSLINQQADSTHQKSFAEVKENDPALIKSRATQELRSLEGNLKDDQMAAENAPARPHWRYLKNRIDRSSFAVQ